MSIEFDSNEYEQLCLVYGTLLNLQKSSSTIFTPEDELDRKPFMLMNIKHELDHIIKEYCAEDANSDRPTFYGLVTEEKQ
tara:strand:- start:17 stop:256 length:240 start_codon:yes stop_codon:yes gene_type:complete